VIRLYLIRHAAEKKAGGTCVLTQRGKRRFRRMARAFARLREPIDIVCTSPKSHAQETAEILSRALGRRPALSLEALAPRASPEALLRALAAVRCQSEGIALVGHNRNFRNLLERLGVGKRELLFRKGSIVRVDIDATPAPHACVPRFRLRPSTGEIEDVFVGLRRAPLRLLAGSPFSLQELTSRADRPSGIHFREPSR
jgi:phosphohistidine phosphatase SixA